MLTDMIAFGIFMSVNMNRIYASAWRGRVHPWRVTLAPAALAEPIRKIVLGGEARFRTVLVTRNRSGQSVALK